MMAFILWFGLLTLLASATRGWTRGILITLYILGSILVAL